MARSRARATAAASACAIPGSGCGRCMATASPSNWPAQSPRGFGLLWRSPMKPDVRTEASMRVLIVDDEPLARRGLQVRLKDLPDVDIVGECGNGRDAVSAIAELKPDVVFLDIQMPVMDGFQVLREIQGPGMPMVIFVTAFDEYAIKAFEAHALDYLLKPVDDARLGDALERAREQQDERQAVEHRGRLLSMVAEL